MSESAGSLLQQADARAREALRVYRPLPKTEAFHRSQASQKILRGGNRSGKTTGGAIEFGAYALDLPILTKDGPIHLPRPKRPLLMWIVGYDQRHIGQTIYRELFESGKYKVIPTLNADGTPAVDEKLFPVYETYEPWNPKHVARQNECKPVGPIIPPRFIEKDGITWENKGDYVFNQIVLKNGTVIRAYSSTAKAKQGDAIDYLWIDEDIAFPKHVAEWEARLSDKKGRMIWTAFPHSGNDALFRLSERAKAQEGREIPDVYEEVLRFSDNPFMDAEEKRKRKEGWDDNEKLARDEGEYLFELAQIYDFSQVQHGVHSQTTGGTDKLTDLFAANNDLPEDWTRYLALDPGTATTAALGIAVPPPEQALELGIEFVCEWELYLARHTFEQTAKEVKRTLRGRAYESFYIDKHAAQITHFGQDKTIGAHYEQAFKDAGLRSYRTHHAFEYGFDNVVQRRAITRNLFQERKIRVVVDRCPNFLKEIRQYRRRVVNHEIKDEAVGKNHHLMDCLEYLAMAERSYVPPRQKNASLDPIAATMKRLAELKGKRGDRTYLAAS